MPIVFVKLLILVEIVLLSYMEKESNKVYLLKMQSNKMLYISYFILYFTFFKLMAFFTIGVQEK